MDNWIILKKELAYYGITLEENLRCSIRIQGGRIKTQRVDTTIRQVDKKIEEQKKLIKK